MGCTVGNVGSRVFGTKSGYLGLCSVNFDLFLKKKNASMQVARFNSFFFLCYSSNKPSVMIARP